MTNFETNESWLEAKLSTGTGTSAGLTGVTTLPEWVERVRGPNAEIEAIRKLKADGDAEGYSKRKEKLDYVVMAGDYSQEGRRRLRDPYISSGIVFAELDQREGGANAGEMRDRTFAHPAVLACWISAGGGGIHIAVAVTPKPNGNEQHKAAWQAVVEELELPSESNDRSVKNSNRIAFLGLDPDAKVQKVGGTVAPVEWSMAPSGAVGSLPVHNGQRSGGANLAAALRRYHPADAWNRNPVALGIRLLSDHCDGLVVASDGDTARIYAADPNTGLLSGDSGKVGELLHMTLTTLVSDGWNPAFALEPKARSKYFEWLSSQGSASRAIPHLEANAPTAIQIMRNDPDLANALPEVRRPDEFDADYSVLGCANGLLDFYSLQLLPADQARIKLVTANTGVDWTPGATHPGVDKILPEDQSDIADYYGWALGHRPNRDCAAEISSPGAGKTTRRKAFTAALGPDYVTHTRAETFQVQRYNRGGTAHNGGLFNMRAPARFCFAPEIKGDFDVVTVNDVTGESTYEGRDCGRRSEDFRIGAHLIMQGNHAGEGESLLGIGEASANGGDAQSALMERLRLFDIPDLPPEDRDDTLPDQILTDGFRQAMLVRLAEHAHRMIGYGNTAPESETMAQRLAAQVEAEKPRWVTDCLYPSIKPMPEDTNGMGTPPLDSFHARRMVIRWWDDNETGKKYPSSAAVTRALTTKLGEPRRGKVQKQSDTGGRADAQIWDEWILEE